MASRLSVRSELGRRATPLRAALAATVLLAGVLALVVRGTAPRLSSGLTGRPAPAFALHAEANGEARPGRVTLAAQPGHPVLLLFTYSLCSHCLGETEAVVRLDAAYSRRSLQVLYIDSPAEAMDIVAAYAQRVGVSAQVLLDPGGRTAAAYGIGLYPGVVLVGADGRVRGEWTGETSESTLRSAIESALAAGPR